MESRTTDSASSSGSSRISAKYMMQVVDRLKYNENRKSTTENYHGIWRNFNQFIIRLDHRPEKWEDRILLYCAYLVEGGRKSSTIKSYISAIKWVLKIDGYSVNNDNMIMTSITKACKISNDIVKIRMPICFNLLELLLFEVDRIYHDQVYLAVLYKTIFALGYYGLLRIGEVAKSNHTIKAKNVHLALNKRKLMLVLYSSKTHGRESLPQKIKISGNEGINIKKRNFCPFDLTGKYINLRGQCICENEQFFVFRDKTDVQSYHIRNVLKDCIKKLNLNAKLYTFHSLRIGHATQMQRDNYPISSIMRAGRWTSNAVYRYLKQ